MSGAETRVLLLLLVAGAFSCDGGAPVDEATEKSEGPPAWMLAAVEQPRGLVRNEPGAAPGYVLFTQFTSDKTYLVDLEGRVVHTWTNEKAGGAESLQDDGSLYRLARIPEPPNFRAGGVAGYIQKLSWDGDVLWEWKMGDEKRMPHHDIKPLPNGNILAIAWEQKTAAEARAAGRRVDLIPEQGLWSEWILEIEPLPPNEARIVWEWHVWDHLVQNYEPGAANHGDPSAFPGRLDINGNEDAVAIDEEELEQLKALGYVPDNATNQDVRSDLLHMNAIDYHPRLDQIAVSVPSVGEIWIPRPLYLDRRGPRLLRGALRTRRGASLPLGKSEGLRSRGRGRPAALPPAQRALDRRRMEERRPSDRLQ